MRKLFIGFGVFLFAGCLWGLTLSEMRTEARFHVKDSNTSRQNYSDAQLNNLFNQAHREVVNYTWVIKKSTEITLVQNTTHYALPADFIQPIRVTFEHEDLEEMSMVGLDGKFRGSDWESQSGYPEYYYQKHDLPGYISVQPWPASSSSTGTLRVQYLAQPNTLSSDSDEPFDGDDRYQQYSDVLIWSVVYKIHTIEGVTNKAQTYFNLYQSALLNMVERLGQKPNFWPSFSSERK